MKMARTLLKWNTLLLFCLLAALHGSSGRYIDQILEDALGEQDELSNGTYIDTDQIPEDAVEEQDSNGRSIDQMLEDALENANPGVMDSDSESGLIRVELDMMMKKQEYYAMIDTNKEGQEKRMKRKATNLAKRWANKTVHYKFAQYRFDDKDRTVIMRAMEHWENYTCLSFKEASDETKNYIEFSDGHGCSSKVGMQERPQSISLDPGCRRHSIVVHEVGHALGFVHEQSRTDRDDYVTILEENIEKGRERNFKKYSAATISAHGVNYDYRSVMHYGQYFFSREEDELPTILTKDTDYQDIIGNALGLSFGDIKLANIIYQCNSHCPSKTCPGEGFVGKDCKCWCKGTADPKNQPVVECDGADDESSGEELGEFDSS